MEENDAKVIAENREVDGPAAETVTTSSTPELLEETVTSEDQPKKKRNPQGKEPCVSGPISSEIAEANMRENDGKVIAENRDVDGPVEETATTSSTPELPEETETSEDRIKKRRTPQGRKPDDSGPRSP